MAIDYKVLATPINSVSDYMRAQEEFELKKQLLKAQKEKLNKEVQSGVSTNDPAALRLANEYEAALASGNVKKANMIAAFSKIYDKNVMMTPDGQYEPLPGLPSALGQIEFGKESGTQQARDVYEPSRAGEIEREKLAAQFVADQGKKAKQDVSTMGAVARAREILPKATSGRIENIVSAGARLFGESTEKTKADAQLEIIGAELVGNVPRFEGPQSNIDVQFYREAAADVANPNKSVDDRLAALQAIEDRIALRKSQGLLGEVDPVEESRRAIRNRQQEIGISPAQREDLKKDNSIDGLINMYAR